MKFSLAGKVAIVTGSSRGMGRATAITLAEHGADVVLAARSVADLAEVAAEIERHGRRAVIAQFDLLDIEQAARPVEVAMREFGKLDILVNNAGGAGMYVEGGTAALFETTVRSVEELFRLNTIAPFVTSQAAARVMKEQGHGGVIINVTSTAAFGNQPDVHAYAAAKLALHGMGGAWAKELGAFQIRVNEIAPGAFDTHNLSKRLAVPGAREAFAANTALGRIGDPMDIAAAVLFLASDEASWISGATLAVNGG